jgi:glycosyltransferase involved in cell wall biosynthesis
MTVEEKPEITVVITFHNAEATLAEAIDSVLCQECVNLELLLVDDGSTDASAAVALRFSDPPVRLLRPGRVGRAAALNLGIKQARAELVAILDADDRAHPDRFRAQVAYLREHAEISLVAGNVALISRDGRALGATNIYNAHEHIVSNLFALNPFAHSATAYRRKAALNVGGYNHRCEKSIDFNFYLALLSSGARFGWLQQQLIDLRYYSESWGRRDDRALQIRFGILGLVSFRNQELGHGSLYALTESQWTLLRIQFDDWFDRFFLARHSAREYLKKAAVAWRSQQYAQACGFAWTALRCDPLAPFRRGLGFRYPRDADTFLELYTER